MTKSELIQTIAERVPGVSVKTADEAVNLILDQICDALATGRRIEIRGFGSFSLNYRPQRTGRNPRTGEKVIVPAKYVPHFKAGKDMRERVDAMASRIPLTADSDSHAQANE